MAQQYNSQLTDRPELPFFSDAHWPIYYFCGVKEGKLYKFLDYVDRERATYALGLLTSLQVINKFSCLIAGIMSPLY